MKQIQKMYRKEKAKHQENKNYVVNRTKGASTADRRTGRNVKVVDARLRKDQRNMKIKAKKKGFKGTKNNKGKGASKGAKGSKNQKRSQR